MQQLRRDPNQVGRNNPCPCGSGLKFKFCHGDMVKLAICNIAANEKMIELIREEKIKRGLACKHGVDKSEHCNSCKVGG